MSTILTNLRLRQARPVAAAAFVALTLEACGGHNNPPPPPTVTISVSPTTITVGQSATLTWSSTNAVSCAAGGTGWTGNQQLMGTASESPTAAGSVTYTLTCTGAGGGGGGYGGGGGGAQTAMATATLTVNAPPQTAFVVKPLVADGAGAAATQDMNLVNPWGLVFLPNAPVWTANNKPNNSTLYDGNGAIEPSATQPLVVALPPAANGTAFEPTGIVAFAGAAQAPNDFVVTAGGKSGQAIFIYSGLSGQIAGWSPAVNQTQAISAYTATDKACYRGLAIANNGTGNYLYANDFLGAKIDVFDATWKKQSATAFPFTDPNLPANYAPFGIQAIANGPAGATQIYVSYAMSGSGANQGTCEDTRGAGFGAINVFDANGKLVMELVKTGGALNAPWGMALAPKDFGTLSNALLVSNHADGMIHAYDTTSGTWIGALQT
ncbi:MAG TPA: TIGR03118 family protein, partial [Steroidobacteraceae bacterium]